MVWYRAYHFLNTPFYYYAIWRECLAGSFQLPLYTGIRSSSAPLPAGRLTLPHHPAVHHDSGRSHLFPILWFLLIRNRLPGRQSRWSALRTNPYLFPVCLHIGGRAPRGCTRLFELAMPKARSSSSTGWASELLKSPMHLFPTISSSLRKEPYAGTG